MGNVNMEAYQIHYRGDESVADHLRKIDLDVEKAAALPDLPTAEGKKVLTAITDDQGDTELTYETPEVEPADIAPAFSEETAYSEGDLVYYEGNLYKFTEDHAAGAWDPSEVTPTSAAAEFNELKNTLNDVIEGTTLSSLLTAINSLTEVQKHRCIISINNIRMLRKTTNNYYISMYFDAGSNLFDMYQLSLVSNKVFHATIPNTFVITSTEVEVTSWKIFPN